jgi:hypothetical protein
MARRLRFLGPLTIVALALAAVFGGCSGDAVTPTENDQNNSTGFINGDISASGGTFEYTVDTAGDPNSPISGPFTIRGKNIHYVDSLQALSVDITVEHACRCTFNEPIGLTFLDLLPEGVTVQNPDNGEHGPGAAIVFEFENDDGVWGPFEESLPRTVLFGVDAGVSIAFVARIDIGAPPDEGSIGGVVWHDANENGEREANEPGLAGVEIQMVATNGPEISPPEILWRAITDETGHYQFDGLDARSYEVSLVLRDDLRPTTPTVLHVILVEQNGTVSDFLEADFGLVPLDPPPRPIIEVGDFVDVWGEYAGGVNHPLMSKLIRVTKCNAPRPELVIDTASLQNDTTDVDPCHLPVGALVGPVTGIASEERVLFVMGTPVRFALPPTDTVPDDSTFAPQFQDDGTLCKGIDFDDVRIGDRIAVFARNDPERRTLTGLRICEAPSDADEVHGKVERILTTPMGILNAFVVMRTTVVVTQTTRIEFIP